MRDGGWSMEPVQMTTYLGLWVSSKSRHPGAYLTFQHLWLLARPSRSCLATAAGVDRLEV